MMSGILGSMMMGFGALMTGMFSGIFNTFLWPMWLMMAAWFSPTS